MNYSVKSVSNWVRKQSTEKKMPKPASLRLQKSRSPGYVVSLPVASALPLRALLIASLVP